MRKFNVIALTAAAIASAAFLLPAGAEALVRTQADGQAATPIENVSYDYSAWRYRRHHHRHFVIVRHRSYYAHRHHRRIFFVHRHHRPYYAYVRHCGGADTLND